MASRTFLVMVLVATVAAPAFAMDHMVGDDAGWKLGVNYNKWAAGKMFYVGDTLTFMYDKDSHNVFKVNGDEFKQCASTNTSNRLDSGNDVIPLKTPGKKWYICGVSGHCSQGMKLVITVSDALAPAPPPSAAEKISPLKSVAWVLAAFLVFKMIMA